MSGGRAESAEALMGRLKAGDDSVHPDLRSHFANAFCPEKWRFLRLPDALGVLGLVEERTWKRLVQSRQAWDPRKGSFHGWLYCLARHESYDVVRSELKRRSPNVALEWSGARDELLATRECGEVLVVKLRKRPAADRGIVHAYYFWRVTAHQRLAEWLELVSLMIVASSADLPSGQLSQDLIDDFVYRLRGRVAHDPPTYADVARSLALSFWTVREACVDYRSTVEQEFGGG